MTKSLYLINPACDFPAYFTAEVYQAKGLNPTILVADLAIATVAAMAPGDFHVQLCDENISVIDLDSRADFICITGKITQWGHMRKAALAFRQRGKTVIIGGPFASLSPDVVRPYCDILVRGELEEIAEGFFRDLRCGQWQDEYVGDKPDLRLSPVPRWDLYPNDRALVGSVQTSRGCPFECEFCDVIQYLGRKQRHKPVDQVLRELNQLYSLGYRNILLCDDNLTVYRKRAKELMEALRDWNNSRTEGRVSFETQVSIDSATDGELLSLCADAGLKSVFVGIETPNEESLLEAKKRQNMKVNLADQVQCFVDNGIAVIGGMICGFDNDGPDIFQRQYEFAMATSIPIFTIGALVAPAATPLYERMEREARLISQGAEVAALPWSTNITPKKMSMEELLAGLHWLCNKLYDCDAFEERVMRMADTFGRNQMENHSSQKANVAPRRSASRNALLLLAELPKLGPREAKMWSRVSAYAMQKPAVGEQVMGAMLTYMQIRHMYEYGKFWEPHLSMAVAPAAQMKRPAIMLKVEAASLSRTMP